MSYANRVYRQRNAHTHDEAKNEPFFKKQYAVNNDNKKSGFFQTKLSVNQPGDSYEKEADAVASTVVNRSSQIPVVQQKKISSIQRLSTSMEDEKLGTNDARMQKDKEIQEKPMPAGEDLEKEKLKGIQKKDEPLKEEDKLKAGAVQTKTEGSTATASAQLSSRIESKAGTGNKLSGRVLHEMSTSFGTDFSQVNIHTDADAVQMNKELNAQAFTNGSDIYFNNGKYSPETSEGKELLAHELTHVIQQKGEEKIQRQKSKKEPWIKKVSVDLTPSQSASLEWAGTPPVDAPGTDSFTVSTGKGYSNPGDDPGTCLRTCCTNAEMQCDAPFNKPSKTGACCTYVGKGFWTGRSVPEHNGWKWWTPIQPWYSKRAIALHQHDTVTGQPIGHGCVRMDEPNAKRIYDFSVIGYTQVEISGRASPVECSEEQKCDAAKSKTTKDEGSVTESKEGKNP